MSRIKYSLSQAKKNIARNGLMSIASLLTIVSCLLVLGLFLILSMNIGYVTDQIKDRCEIQVYLYTDTAEERVEAIKGEIENSDNIKSVELYTKEEALEEMKNTMFEGKEEMLEGFDGDENPLPDSYKIAMNDISLASETAESLKQIEGVEKVDNNQGLVNKIISLSNSLRWVTIIIMLVLLLIAVVIISNTVRLTVYNRRKEIGIMKYIGATDRFIRVPFIFEGVIIGLLGALLSFIIMAVGYWFLLDWIKNNFAMFQLIGILPVSICLAAVFFIVGGFIGMIGSLFSMKKYLRV